MIRVPVSPGILRWARKRSGVAYETLTAKFKKLPEWEEGKTDPTLRQLEAFARAVHVPVGYLFLTELPEENVPIPDYRTFAAHEVTRPSPNLLDTIYTCQERQSWYRDFVRIAHQPELGFVGSATINTSPKIIASEMRKTLGFDLIARQKCRAWTDALRMFIRQADAAGVLVMISGVVMSNNHWSLDPTEFRAFALSDPHAPLVFINGRDTKATQMFTLAHELARIWLGSSGLSNLGVAPRSGFRREEMWCDAVAAELLVPLAALQPELRQPEPLPEALSRLARAFKVSTLVILRRLLDTGWIDRACFDDAWGQEIERLRVPVQDGTTGADFYRTTLSRVSIRFARSLIMSTLEGHTLYRDAFRMLGITKTSTISDLGRRIGVTR